MLNNRWVTLFKNAGMKWQRDECLHMGAAIAYYALFSLFPLILVILSLVGFVINPNDFDVQQRLVDLIGSPEVREVVLETLRKFSESRVNAGLIGFGALVLTASGIFGVLDRSFDVIWERRQVEKRGLMASVRSAVVDRLIAFALVGGCALLLLLSVVSTVLVTTVSSYTNWLPNQGLMLQSLQFIISLLLIALAFGALYRVLAGRSVLWGDVWLGAIVAALLFGALQKVVGIYLSRTDYASYGAVGGVMALLVWIYLTSQVLLIGAQIAYAYAQIFGSRRTQQQAPL